MALIPAKAHSRSVPEKNIRPLAGKSLVQWAIEAARSVPAIERIVVSTDSPTIAMVAATNKAEALQRPASLAQDDTPMFDVIKHALLHNIDVDTLVLLQPTSPMRDTQDIEAAIAMLVSNRDSVVSVIEVPEEWRPEWTFRVTWQGLVPTMGWEAVSGTRQELTARFVRDGTVYVFRASHIRRGGDLYGRAWPLIIDRSASVNINTEKDWDRAEQMMQERIGAVV